MAAGSPAVVGHGLAGRHRAGGRRDVGGGRRPEGRGERQDVGQRQLRRQERLGAIRSRGLQSRRRPCRPPGRVVTGRQSAGPPVVVSVGAVPAQRRGGVRRLCVRYRRRGAPGAARPSIGAGAGRRAPGDVVGPPVPDGAGPGWSARNGGGRGGRRVLPGGHRGRRRRGRRRRRRRRGRRGRWWSTVVAGGRVVVGAGGWVVVVGGSVVVVVGGAVVVVVGGSVDASWSAARSTWSSCSAPAAAVGRRRRPAARWSSSSSGGAVVVVSSGAGHSTGGWAGSAGGHSPSAPAITTANGTEGPAPVPTAPTRTAPAIRATVIRRWAADVDTGISDPVRKGTPGGRVRQHRALATGPCRRLRSDFSARSGRSCPLSRGTWPLVRLYPVGRGVRIDAGSDSPAVSDPAGADPDQGPGGEGTHRHQGRHHGHGAEVELAAVPPRRAGRGRDLVAGVGGRAGGRRRGFRGRRAGHAFPGQGRRRGGHGRRRRRRRGRRRDRRGRRRGQRRRRRREPSPAPAGAAAPRTGRRAGRRGRGGRRLRGRRRRGRRRGGGRGRGRGRRRGGRRGRRRRGPRPRPSRPSSGGSRSGTCTSPPPGTASPHCPPSRHLVALEAEAPGVGRDACGVSESDSFFHRTLSPTLIVVTLGENANSPPPGRRC